MIPFPSSANDRIYRHVTVIASVGLILFGCLTVLKPFLAALMLAVIFCTSTWPAFDWLQRKLKGRSTLAAFLMTILLAALFVLPLVFLGSSLVESFHTLMSYVFRAAQTGPYTLPAWVTGLPVVGARVQQGWASFTGDRARMTQALREVAGPTTEWLLLFGGGVGHGILQVALGVFISFFLFCHGKTLVVRVQALVVRFVGPGALRFLTVTERTMMSLVYGILGTALVLGVLSTIAFYIADVPGAPFLGLLTFLFAIIPGGPPFVLFPVAVWLFYMGRIGMGVFMAVWALASMGLVDMAIRPYFISLGSKMPLVLILLGVLGGVISFGFIGLFIGPALLSVAYAMISEWSQAEPARVEDAHG
jgi:predicted PurR-regulated permease PerM